MRKNLLKRPLAFHFIHHARGLSMGMAHESFIQNLIEGGYLKSPHIIQAFRAIDRADFVLPEYAGEAHGNYPLPIGEGQTISQPLTVAFMLELLDPRPGERILDVGAGSGWTAALLAHSVKDGESKTKGKVLAMERIKTLCEFGKRNIRTYNFIEKGIVQWICGDGTQGFPEHAPYDKILAGAAASREIPQSWRAQVKVGGRIVAPIGGSIWLFIKKSETEWEEKEFPGFAFVPLVKDQRDTNIRMRTNYINRAKKKKWLAGFLIFFSISSFFYEIYIPHASFEGTKRIVIEKGLGSRKIGELLKKEGVIRSKWAFVTYASLTGKASQLKPGAYTIGQFALPKLTRVLTQEEINERTVTIPEGWNAEEIAGYFENQDIFGRKEFLQAVAPGEADGFIQNFSFLSDKPAGEGLEGYLFPDTYRVFMHAAPRDAVLKMLDNFDQKVTEDLRTEIFRQKKTIFEIVTMASLIEKEVVSDEDRALVSGILWKRLALGIPLQVDATINYIKNYELRIKNYEKKNRISLNDTKIDSPYNTYLYKGLPKGPIANPGISAIRAAIHPKKSPYLYYLSARDDGRTVFSQTLEEHNEAKARYLK